MKSGDMRTNAETYNAMYRGRWALSVACVEGAAAAEIAKAAPFLCREIRVSTVGAIRTLGYDVFLSGKPPHATLMLDREPSEETWEALRGVFGPIVSNPRFNEEEVSPDD